jgi:hypothetical protein
MPKARKDYLVTLDVTPADKPSLSMHAMTRVERIWIAPGTGINCVTFRCGYDFHIQVDRLIAERLRDDLTRWLEKNPEPR